MNEIETTEKKHENHCKTQQHNTSVLFFGGIEGVCNIHFSIGGF